MPFARHVTLALPLMEQLAEQVAAMTVPAQSAGQLPLGTVAVGRPAQLVGVLQGQIITTSPRKR
jgi:hypothetical protein